MGLLRAVRALALAACPILAAPPAMAAFDYNDTSWEGASELLGIARQELGGHRVELVAQIPWGDLEPGDGILVLRPMSAIDYDEASAFMRAGGRLAVLDDHGEGDEFLERFQIRRIAAPKRPRDSLRGKPALAIAVPALQSIAGYEQGRHPVVADVKQVVTNHPTALAHPDLTQVLQIPAVGEPDATLAVTGIILNRGRLFAMADPSALINLMMRYPGNRALGKGLIGYLVEDDSWGTRSGKLYLVANDFTQTGQYGGGASFTKELRAQLDGFEELIDDARRDGLPSAAAIGLAALAVVVSLAWVALASVRTYKRRDPRFARPTPLVAQGGMAGRAALLAAKTTHRALALLELKSALHEGLALRLGVDASAGFQRLKDEIHRQDVLGRRSSDDLERLVRELDEAEVAVTQQLRILVTVRAVESARRRVGSILREVDERIGSKR